MSYGLMDLASSVEGQARGGLRQAADAEHQRNKLNQQIDDAEAAEKRSLVGTAATVAADAGLNTYYAAAEAKKVADAANAAQATLNTNAAVATDAIAAAETAKTVAATQEAAAGAKAIADAAAVTEATTAATTVAPTVAAPVAAGGTAVTSAGPLATLGPAGWAALAGLALYSFL